MPSAFRLAQWKHATLNLRAADVHPSGSTVGSLLGIATVHDSVLVDSAK
jgi:hypothetical protein